MNEQMDELSVAERRDLAMREVLGLLEPDEEARFGRSFDALSPQDQAEILDLQAAIASEIGGLGDDLPDRALRYQVLARLAEEIDHEDLDVSPIASIGADLRRRGSSDRRQQLSQGAEGLSENILLERLNRSSKVWRAAAIALAAAFLSVLVFQRSTQSSVDQIVAMLDSAMQQETFRDRLPDLSSDSTLLEVIESPAYRRLTMNSPASSEFGAILAVRKPSPANAGGDVPSVHKFVLVQAVEGVRAFDLVGVSSSGKVTVLEAGIGNLPLASIQFTNDEMANFERFELRDSQSGAVVFLHRRA